MLWQLSREADSSLEYCCLGVRLPVLRVTYVRALIVVCNESKIPNEQTCYHLCTLTALPDADLPHATSVEIGPRTPSPNM